MAEPADRIAADALALAGDDGAAWVVAMGEEIPATDDPWQAPIPGLATPPELEGLPDGPR